MNGHRLCRIFDPHKYSMPDSHGWSNTDSLNVPRWYPTLTTLGDGRVMAFSGLQYFELMTFGGTLANGTAVDTLSPMVLERSPYWNAGDVPVPDVTLGTDRPSARTDAAIDASIAVRLVGNDAGGVAMMFGGTDGTTPKGDLWVAWREGFHTREAWKWVQPPADAGRPAPFQVLPQARSEHSLVIQSFSDPNDARNDTVFAYVYGGLRSGGAVDDTVWLIRYYRTHNTGSADDYRYYSVRVPTTSTGPGARYGHIAAFDPGPLDPATSRPVHPRMLVFGGKQANGWYADNKVYALDLDTRVWSVVNDGGTGSGFPAKRYQARGAFIPAPSEYQPLNLIGRWFVSGGQDSLGGRFQQLWRLHRCNNAPQACSNSYTWTNWTPGGTPGPGARSRHVLTWDLQWRRLILTGGSFANGTLAQDTTWFLPVDIPDSCAGGGASCLYWRAIPLAGKSPVAKQGQVSTYFQVPVNARKPEIYDPAATGSKWSLLNAPHYTKETYPFMFLLPSGNVFEAGRDQRTVLSESSAQNLNDTRVFVASQTAWGTPINSPFTGSSAVMYRPGLVLKTDGGTVTSARISLTGSPAETGTWENITSSPMLPREEPNLVMLPSGDVLAMGGRLEHRDGSPPQPEPQIYDVESGSWSDELSPDPSSRGYHSTALLLPDARVLSLGGNLHSSDSIFYAAVFEPPYLFNGSSYATRPLITSADTTMCYGQTRWVGTNRAGTIRSVALVRPGATTHAFDQNQRYVPLNFTADVANNRLLVSLPADGNTAPPGDYLLFLVDELTPTVDRVPSVARWVRLKQDLVPPDSLPVLGESEIVCNEAWFSFNATADDHSLASSGTASTYDFRYQASSATTPGANRETWFDGMTQASGEPTPAVSGTTQGFSFTGLGANTWYWFALRSIDVCGNKSPISAFRARMLAASACSGEEFICVHCNGGGGGNRSGESRAAVGGAGAPAAESPSVLDGAAPELDREDLIPVTVEPDADGRLELALQSAGTRSIAIDRLRLLTVQHDPDEIALASGGSVLTGRPAAISGAWLDDSVSTPGLVEGGLFEPLALFDGRSVRVELSPSSAPSRTLLVDCTRPGRGMLPPEAGIEVQVRDAAGAWTTAGQIYPRTTRTTLAISGLVGDRARLVMHGDVRLWGVSELVMPTTPAVVSELSPLAAIDAGLGDARALLLSDDDARLDFTGPDTLRASFVVPGADAGMARSLFLAVQAQVGPTLGGQTRSMRREPATTPPRFALYQSRPNPSRGGALIPFDLPRAATVRLELFDLQGRRLQRVVTSLDAGHHELRLHPSSSQLAPGILTYRLTADGYRAERKLVVLP